MEHPQSGAAEENFENLRRQFADHVQSVRDICDDSVDARVFLAQTEAAVRRALADCERALAQGSAQSLVENSALAARLSNRLLMALDRESDNSDDPSLRRQVGAAGERLKSAIAAFVQASKSAAAAAQDSTGWRSASARLMQVVSEVARLFDDLNMYGLDSARQPQSQPQQPPLQKPVNIVVTPPPPPPSQPPPRPPLPHEARVPGRPPMPSDTDDEEGLFSGEPGMKRPIHAAAQGLYREVSKVCLGVRVLHMCCRGIHLFCDNVGKL